jgi:hypothetical protein
VGMSRWRGYKEKEDVSRKERVGEVGREGEVLYVYGLHQTVTVLPHQMDLEKIGRSRIGLGDRGTQGPLDHDRGADSRKAQTSHILPTLPPRISRATSTVPSSSIEVQFVEMMVATYCHEVPVTVVARKRKITPNNSPNRPSRAWTDRHFIDGTIRPQGWRGQQCLPLVGPFPDLMHIKVEFAT